MQVEQDQVGVVGFGEFDAERAERGVHELPFRTHFQQVLDDTDIGRVVLDVEQGGRR